MVYSKKKPAERLTPGAKPKPESEKALQCSFYTKGANIEAVGGMGKAREIAKELFEKHVAKISKKKS